MADWLNTTTTLPIRFAAVHFPGFGITVSFRQSVFSGFQFPCDMGVHHNSPLNEGDTKAQSTLLEMWTNTRGHTPTP